jgi:hypothetical protein
VPRYELRRRLAALEAERATEGMDKTPQDKADSRSRWMASPETP